MSSKALWKLRMDPEFQHMNMPLPETERRVLEETVSSGGQYKPVTVWGRTVIEGYEQYQLYTRYGIIFTVNKMEFSSREDAHIWVCRRQLAEGQLSKAGRRYLLGRLYLAERTKNPMLTCAQIAGTLFSEYGVTLTSLNKYSSFAKKLDLLRQTAPELVKEILAGKRKIDCNRFILLDRGERKPLRELLQATPCPGGTAHFPIPSTVKDMPAFDPDGPLMSLALTIPSWVQILEQARAFSAVSPECRQKLEQALFRLYESAEKALLGMWEE